MAELTVVAPLLPGRAEAWRRFCQEVRGRRRAEYEVSRTTLSISRESAWLLYTPCGNLALISVEAAEPYAALQELASSERPFDRWFRRHLWEICGLDLSCLQTGQKRELVFHWSLTES
ncbi:MAG: hypothetical protein ACOC9X_03290 [bacterium]